jgi:uncharacterized protein (DUF305 family)
MISESLMRGLQLSDLLGTRVSHEVFSGEAFMDSRANPGSAFTSVASALAIALIVILGLLIFETSAHAKAGALRVSQFDIKFLDQMTVHHEEVITMGELAEAKAENSELKKMAGKMVSDQREEIVQMKRWRDHFYPKAPQSSVAIPKVDITGLKKKSGQDFDFAFIDLMATLHEQEINLVKNASDRLFNPDIKAFAQNVMLKRDRERSELERLKIAEKLQSSATQR